MTGKMRLYLEKVIARMNLDDTQREAVEREFTGHLEEAVAGAMQGGLTLEDAEAQAMTTFGEPSVIARQFGLAHGNVWLIFEALALGLVFFLLFRTITGDAPASYRIIYAALWSLVAISSLLWNKVEVNGGLRVRRWMRPTRKITFDSIADVRFQKGHLLGARNIIIETSDHKTAIFSPKFRNARCAGLALTVLAPEAVRPEVMAYFKKRVFPIHQERFWQKIIVSGFWIAALAAFATTIDPLWNLRGFNAGLIVASILTLIASWCQVSLLVNRAKKGVSLLIVAGFILAVSLYVALALGYLSAVRWYCLSIPALCVLALAVLWWSWSRKALFLVSLALVAVLGVAPWLIPSVEVADGWQCGSHAFMPERSVWMHGAKPLCAITGISYRNSQQYNLIMAAPDNFQVYDLPEGDWCVIDTPGDESLTLVYSNQESLTEMADVDFCQFFPQLDVPMTKFASTRFKGAWFKYFLQVIPFYSPSGDYYVLPEAVSDDEMPRDLNVVDWQNDESQLHGGLFSETMWWDAEDRLHIVRPVEGDEERDPEAPQKIEVSVIDARSGLVQHQKTFTLPKNFTAGMVFCPPLIRVDNRSSLSTFLLNIETGQLKELPQSTELMHSNWKTHQIAYVTKTDGRPRLTIENSEGIQYQRDFSVSESIAAVRISPDGTKYFYVHWGSDGMLFGGIVSHRVCDMATGEESPLMYSGMLAGVMEKIAVPAMGCPVNRYLWSENSETIVYPVFSYPGKGDTRKSILSSIIWSTP